MLAVGAASAPLLAGCGAIDPPRTALAVRSARWVGPEAVALTLECAELESAEVDPTAGVDGIPLVTAWGAPRLGRCDTQLVVPVPPTATRIDDAATGMVVDLPPRPT